MPQNAAPKLGPEIMTPRYVDIRRTGGGIMFTIGPNRVGQPFMTRLRYETAAAMADAFDTDQRWVTGLGDGRYGVGYSPNLHGSEIGSLIVVDVETERALCEWIGDRDAWSRAAKLLRQVARYERLAAEPGPWSPGEYALCEKCGRPIFDEDPTLMIPGMSAFVPLSLVCQYCGAAELEQRDGAQS